MCFILMLILFNYVLPFSHSQAGSDTQQQKRLRPVLTAVRNRPQFFNHLFPERRAVAERHVESDPQTSSSLPTATQSQSVDTGTRASSSRADSEREEAAPPSVTSSVPSPLRTTETAREASRENNVISASRLGDRSIINSASRSISTSRSISANSDNSFDGSTATLTTTVNGETETDGDFDGDDIDEAVPAGTKMPRRLPSIHTMNL